MTGLAEFLLARITEDEEFARLGIRLRESPAMQVPAPDVQAGTTALLGVVLDDPEAVETIARYTRNGVKAPGEAERTLADCAAKRRIVEMHAPVGGGYSPPDSWYGDQNRCESCAVESGRAGVGLGVTVHRRGWPCPTLKLLALPYADHPDYREEWSL